MRQSAWLKRPDSDATRSEIAQSSRGEGACLLPTKQAVRNLMNEIPAPHRNCRGS